MPTKRTISISAPASCEHSFFATLDGESYKSAHPPGSEYVPRLTSLTIITLVLSLFKITVLTEILGVG